MLSAFNFKLLATSSPAVLILTKNKEKKCIDKDAGNWLKIVEVLSSESIFFFTVKNEERSSCACLMNEVEGVNRKCDTVNGKNYGLGRIIFADNK